MQQPDRTSTRRQIRVKFKHVGAVVLGLRVVRLVHGDGLRVMVAGDVRADAHGVVYRGGHATPSSKEVNDNLFAEIQHILGTIHLANGHAHPISSIFQTIGSVLSTKS